MMLFKKKGVGFQPAPFTETREKIKNPGRGFFEIHTFALGQDWDLENLRWCIREDQTIALVLLDIRAARDRELAPKELSLVDAMLGAFEELDQDILLRVVYDREGKGMQNEPALLSRVTGHMRQLAPLIQAHRRHILLLQGLLVGSWGEMHTSKFLQPSAVRQLAEVWLEETNLPVAVRTPAFHRILCGGGQDGRIALYNDGLFGSETDMGTYEDRERDLEYIREHCRHSLNGGEAVLGESRPGAKEVVDRLRRLHIAYLNKAHDVRMLEHFRSLRFGGENLYDYVEAHMGYRFVVRRAALKVSQGGLQLEIQVENTGFGNLCQAAEALLILEEPDGGLRELPLDADPRGFEAGTVTTISADISGPSTAIVCLTVRRRADGKCLQFANQGQREGRVILGALGGARLPLS